MNLSLPVDIGKDKAGFSVCLSGESQASGVNNPNTAMIVKFDDRFVSVTEHDNVCFVLHCLIKKSVGSVIYAFTMTVCQ